MTPPLSRRILAAETAVADATRVSTAYGKKYVIPLDFEAVTNHGAFYPRVLGSEMQFEVTLADTTNILQQDSRTRPSVAAFIPTA